MSDRTHTTEAAYSQYSVSASTARFHLSMDHPHLDVIPVHYKGKPAGDDESFSVSSRISIGSTMDGVDVLGAGEAPQNFRDWIHLLAARIVSTVVFKRTVLFLILICALLLGVRTFDPIRNDPTTLAAINLALHVLLVTFSVELVVSVVFYQEQILSAGWLAMDIAIILLAWCTADVSILVLRSFRLIRALRKASGVPAVKWAVKAVLRVLPRLTAVLTVLLPGMFVIFAILFTNLYQDAMTNGVNANNDGKQLSENYFGRLDVSALTLFQIMTGGRNWSVICAELQTQYPSAWLPMVSFVVIALFFFGSLIIAVMCDAVSNVNQDRMWKSLDRTHTAPSTTANDPLLVGGGQYEPHSYQKADFHQMQQTLDGLATSVDALVRMQAVVQESVNSLVQREMARKLELSHQREITRKLELSHHKSKSVQLARTSMAPAIGPSHSDDL